MHAVYLTRMLLKEADAKHGVSTAGLVQSVVDEADSMYAVYLTRMLLKEADAKHGVPTAGLVQSVVDEADSIHAVPYRRGDSLDCHPLAFGAGRLVSPVMRVGRGEA